MLDIVQIEKAKMSCVNIIVSKLKSLKKII